MSGEVTDNTQNGDVKLQNGVTSGESGGEAKINLGYVDGETDTDGYINTDVHFDIEAHDIFSELDVFDTLDEEWVEYARWIKYEQTVEDDADRWSKPHVSSLNFHSLIELRKCLEHGSLLFDVTEDSVPDIMKRISKQLVEDHQLHELDEGIFRWTIQQKRRYMRPESAFHQISRNRPWHRNSHRHLHFQSPSRRHSEAARRGSRPHLRHSRHRRERKTSTSSGSRKRSQGEMNKGFVVDQMPTLTQAVRATTKDVGIASDEARSKARYHWTVLKNNLGKVTGSPRKQDFQTLVHQIMDLLHAQKFLKHLPEGSESGSVMVGEVDFVNHPVCIFVRLSEGRNMGIQLVEVPLPVRFLFIYLAPEYLGTDIVEIGRTMGTLLSNPRFKSVAYEAQFRRDLLDGFDTFMDDSIVLPIGQHYDQETLLPILHTFNKREREMEAQFAATASRRASVANISLRKAAIELEQIAKDSGVIGDPLVRTGRFFGGLINDAKRRWPKYKSDITDAFNSQSMGAILFIYFAVLAPAIAFGGLIGEKTGDLIGVPETFLISSVAGIFWAFVSAQPMVVIGVTGPVLIFEESLAQICESLNIDFLATHFWVGIWLAVISVAATGFEVSCLLRHVSRFTQDIFAFLISCVFIYESLRKIYIIFVDHPLEEYYVALMTTIAPTVAPARIRRPENYVSVFNVTVPTNITTTDVTDTTLSDKDKVVGQPNTALLSLVWCFGTFYLARILKSVKGSHYFGKLPRKLIGDFAIPLAIAVMVVLDIIIKDTYTEKLHVPDGFEPTDASKRGWVISPLRKDLPIWAIFFAIVPAALFFILMFMESQVTSLIVNKNLVKGSGYHLDLMLIGVFGALSGILGLPFICGATVRSVTHLNALCVFSKTYAPGEKPTLEYVIEQRVTSIFFYLLLGFSILMGPVLKHIPLSVLFGIFLYMGVTSLNGIQFWDRFKLLFIPVKHHPDEPFVRRVKTYKMHIFTGIQILIFVILWAVKSTKASLAFPFLLILCVPVRKYILPKIFDDKELAMLDADDDTVIEEED